MSLNFFIPLRCEKVRSQTHFISSQRSALADGKKTTLHKVWDGMSIRELYPEFGKDYEKFRVALDKSNAKKRAKICKGTTADWLIQNAKDCRYIYDEIDRGDHIDYDYILRNQKLSKQQCLRASYRLAHVLNECLK